MAMSPRKKEAGAGGTSGSAVNIGNAAPGGKKAKKPKKMRGGGSVGDPIKMKDGGFPDLSGDGKVTQKDVLMGKGVIKRNMGGKVSKKSGVIKGMRSGGIAKKKGG
jgi:hypothetical protein